MDVVVPDSPEVPAWFDQRTTASSTAVTGHDALAPRWPLDGDTQVDVVVVVGAGFAGLRAAHHLLEADPSLDVLVVDTAGVRTTHIGGYPLAVTRDQHPSIGYDEDARFARAGGYGSDGVATSNLAGRTIADPVTESNSAVVHRPWIGHRSPRWEPEARWEPEPLCWAGVTAGLRSSTLADLEERLTGPPSRVAHALAPLLGH